VPALGVIAGDVKFAGCVAVKGQYVAHQHDGIQRWTYVVSCRVLDGVLVTNQLVTSRVVE
jgi:hypothetical protein